MKYPNFITSSLFLTAALLTSVAEAVDFTWTNMTENGSLLNTAGHAMYTGSNWSGGVTPTFNDQSHLIFTGLGTGGTSSTVYLGGVSTTLNRLTTSTLNQLRFNNAFSTLAFQGSNQTIDHQSGTLRLDIRISSSAGITKTGAGTVFSNLQSVSSGFTGPLTISQGIWTSGNNNALGEEKTVNIQSGGTANMNGQLWGSSTITGGSTVARNYTFNIAGTGSSGQGAIINGAAAAVSTTTGISGIRNLNLTANASVGGSGDFNIGHGGTLNGNGYTLTKSGTNSIWISGAASNISYQVDAGRLVGFNTDNAFGGSAGSVSVGNGGTLASSGARSFANTLSLAGGSTLENLTSNTATWSGATSLSSGQAIVTGANSTAHITMSGVISGNGGITKQGTNTLTLTRGNTFTGKTIVSAGQFRLASGASISSSSEIQIASGATLNAVDAGGITIGAGKTFGGGGTILGDVLINGAHTPGFSPGLQTFSNNLSYGSGASVVWELNANTAALLSRGTSYDGIDVVGNLSFNGPTSLTLSFDLSGSTVDWSNSLWSNPLLGTSGWKVYDVDGTISGLGNLQISSNWLDSNGQSLSSIRPGYTFALSQAVDGIYLNYTVVPETSTTLLLALFSGASLLRRKRD
ncbi:MAG: beta strand repeat-containing protein [Akkermansiaceae bacterium]